MEPNEGRHVLIIPIRFQFLFSAMVYFAARDTLFDFLLCVYRIVFMRMSRTVLLITEKNVKPSAG